MRVVGRTGRRLANSGCRVRLALLNVAQGDWSALRVRLNDGGQDALDLILAGVTRVVTVSEGEIAAAMRIYYSDTHNVVEGAGAAPLAALIRDRDLVAGLRVGLVISGGNVDRDVYRGVLSG